MIDWYYRISFVLMCLWVAFIVLADLWVIVFNLDSYGARTVEPLNWVIVFFLLPFVNILFLYIIYRLWTKGTRRDRRIKTKCRKH